MSIVLAIIVMVFILAMVFGLVFNVPAFMMRRKKRRKEKAVREKFVACPLKGLPDIETEVFGQRVTAFEIWRKSYGGSWTPDGVKEWEMEGVSLSFERRMCDIGFCSEYNRIATCYKNLGKIKIADLCQNGYRYLVVEFYYASLVVKELVDQTYRLKKLKDLAGDELLPDERLDPVLNELFLEVNLIIERYFEGELFELVKMAITEQFGTTEALQDKLPSGSSCRTTTAEEIARLKLLVNSILTGSRGDQLVLVSDIYPEEAKLV